MIDEGSNLSDHLPLVVTCQNNVAGKKQQNRSAGSRPQQRYLRWDRANLSSYYTLTGSHLQVLLDEVKLFESNLHAVAHVDIITYIETVYNTLVSILKDSANATVPLRTKNFYKFWWDQELDCLKEDSVSSHRLWKSAGKPRSGPLYDRSRRCKLLYKKRIRECEHLETSFYTNDLHEALIKKQGTSFWKTWRSKFGSSSKHVSQVNGLADDYEILEVFKKHFADICSTANTAEGSALQDKYSTMRQNYTGLPFDDYLLFDVELVDKSVRSLAKGKAAGLDELSSEHLQHCHPSLSVLLSKLFNIIVKFGYVPSGFGLSYAVPLPKNNYITVSKSLSVDDFRCISISAVLSKVFEKCILDRYQRFFETSDGQFGFKQGIGCSHAIYTVKNVVDNFITRGSTVNLCALDLSKAFDKINHYGLFIKLMERMLPVRALCVIEYWFSVCYTCVRWNGALSDFYQPKCGVRQGGILSPYFFAVYVDDLIKTVQRCNYGCKIGIISVNIFLYADDIILLAPSVNALQKILTIAETHLTQLEMTLNAKKSVCMRIGKCFKADCCSLYTLAGEALRWVKTVRYLGVYIVSAKRFACSIEDNMKSFYRSFNCIMCKVGNCASEDTLLTLVFTKCLPVLMYGFDVCPVTRRHERTLDFTATRIFMRIFKTNSVDIVNECLRMFGLRTFSVVAGERKNRFLCKAACCENIFVQIFSDHLITVTN